MIQNCIMAFFHPYESGHDYVGFLISCSQIIYVMVMRLYIYFYTEHFLYGVIFYKYTSCNLFTSSKINVCYSIDIEAYSSCSVGIIACRITLTIF